MKITIGELRKIIKEVFETQPSNSAYDRSSSLTQRFTDKDRYGSLAHPGQYDENEKASMEHLSTDFDDVDLGPVPPDSTDDPYVLMDPSVRDWLTFKEDFSLFVRMSFGESL